MPVTSNRRNANVPRALEQLANEGGARRTWLWGIDKLRKRYQIAAAAHNLAIVMRKLFGMGTPRGLQVFVDLALALYLAILTLHWRIIARAGRNETQPTDWTPQPVAA
jgi:hypothetical protein